MATLETQQLDDIIVKSRRKMLSLGTSALAGLVLGGVTKKAEAQAAINDNDILNFALNLEYLEANFYNLAVNGVTIDKLGTPIPITGTGTQGTVVTKANFAPVPFTSTIIKAYAEETAIEEGKHVVFLQSQLGSMAVAQPQIDLVNSFYALATAAGITAFPAPGFDPFASDAAFLIGAYIFEDVGVTAYHGAAGSISSSAVLSAAVGIHAVEAYHAGLIRTTINAVDAAAAYYPTGTLTTFTQQISKLRSTLANPTPPPPPTPFLTNGGLMQDDQGIDNSQMVALNGSSPTYPSTTIVDADFNSIGFARTPQQVLAIVTNTTPTSPSPHTGLFFPNGLNGTIN